MKKSIVRNSILNIIYKLVNIVFPMITSIYVARVLLPEGVGKISYAQNILSYFICMASLGIPVYGAREMAKITSKKEASDKLFSELFLLNLIATIGCSLIYLGIVIGVPFINNQRQLFLVVGIQLLFNIFNVDWFYTGNEEYAYITIRTVVIKIISVILVFLFVKETSDLIPYVLINTLMVSTNYIINAVKLKKRVSLSFRNLYLKVHLKPISILFLTILATDLYNQIDVTMMGWMCSNAEIGYYAYAIKLIRIITSISTAIAITTLPRICRYYSEHRSQEFVSLNNRTLKVLLTLALPCMLGLISVSSDAVYVVYGQSFMPAAKILSIASPILLFVPISYECGTVILTAVNKEKFLLLATFLGVLTNICLNSILIPRYGGRGAAFASVVAELIVFIVHLICAMKYIKFETSRRDLISLFFSSGFMIFGVEIIQNSIVDNAFLRLLFSVLVGGIIYVVSMILMKNTIVIWLYERFTKRLSA